MVNILLSFITAFVITFVAIPSIIKVANIKHLFDEPDERKAHKSKIPTLGGLAIFAGIVIAFTFWSASGHYSNNQYILSAILVLFFIGIKDDIFPLSPIKKFIGQIISTLIIVFPANIRLTSLCGIFGVYEIPLWFSIALSMFTILVIINAFNLIDGIDGLAAGIGVVASSTFGILFYQSGSYELAILAFALTGSLLAFLRFNFSPAKIFMGDTGSLIVGLVLSVLAITLIEFNKTSLTGFVASSKAPAISIAILIIPLFDTLRVFCIRLLRKQSPFKADKNHIHHGLLEIGFTHKTASLLLCLVNVIFIGVVLLLKDNIEIHYLLLTLFFLALVLSQIPFIIRTYFKQKINI